MGARSTPCFREIQQSVADQGLRVLAGFHVNSPDRVPPMADGRPAGTLLLVGNAGPTLWPRFCISPEYADGEPDALDRWSTRVAKDLAHVYGAQALFPFGGPPHHPFLSWARRAGASDRSPLGLSLHPRYGLWHAYRFALCLPSRLPGLPGPSRETTKSSPDCRTCAGQPCLQACPVGAFSGDAYDHHQCARFLARNPACECNGRGCSARHACPVGQAYCYPPEQARFHMHIFVAAYGYR